MANAPGGRPAHLPPFVKPFDDLARTVAGYRYCALLLHMGRKSAKVYETPVMAWVTAAGIVVPLAWGERTDWYRNIMAAGEAAIQIDGRWHRVVEPRLIEGEAAKPYLPAMPRLFGLVFPARRFLLLREERRAAV